LRTVERIVWTGVAAIAIAILPRFTFAQNAAPSQTPAQTPAQAPTLSSTQAGVLPVPRACAILDAHVGLRDASVRRNDYASIDTQRIQYALSGCNPGRAVVLEAEGEKNAFLSAPLIVPRGVTLFID
jgi:hypothetical protein